MTTTAAPDVERELVGVLRARSRAIAQAEIDKLRVVVEWSLPHQAPPDVDPRDVGFGARYLAVAGPGAPLVDEFAVTDLATTLGMSDHAGRDFVGQAPLHLPDDQPACRGGHAHRPAAQPPRRRTRHPRRRPTRDGDQGPVRPVTVAKQADGRYSQLGHRERDYDPDSVHGQIRVHGPLDAADALDLEKTVGRVATQLADLGSTESLDVRRSVAVGEIARAQLAVDLGADAGRSVELVVHLSPDSPIARLENTRSPVIVDAVRAWCETAAKVVIRPVIDLDQTVHVTQYEVPDRLRRRVVWRDQTCVSPSCARSAASCDLDHVILYDSGGTTSTDNLAPLCRRHHRAKTHGQFTYRVLTPGAYEWTLPSDYAVRCDHEGTHPPVPPTSSCPAPHPDPTVGARGASEGSRQARPPVVTAASRLTGARCARRWRAGRARVEARWDERPPATTDRAHGRVPARGASTRSTSGARPASRGLVGRRPLRVGSDALG